ncbi:MAG: hypothetical protein ACTSQI_22075 [Candidatus Helarchaeota archaeon]
MAVEIFLATMILIMFALVMAALCVFLLIQIVKSEKIALPFLLSLFIYFFLLCIANIQQVVYNFINMEALSLPSEPLVIYSTFFVYLLTLVAPIYLIFQIEKIYFPNSKLTAKIHIVTVLNVILFSAFVGYVSYLASSDITIITDFNFIDFLLLGGVLLGLQVIFVIIAFLYLGIRATGRYRLYAILVALGWLLNYGANTIAILGTLQSSVILLLLIPKLLGIVLTAFGLYRLYGLRG